eukprot:CAMPEP_0183408582 /NCGR_PEP_ID=MMETSP0370-20130417/18197_1 /TAXON_ID=268820 /ORGANISM="Peridinium aciculiferum, Strain PAER-2" /LENGTH=55 /DNA_ID=CAMNT_0025591117 /DNA_START=163 /DNA_END=327 /DNA_ORIENTATION=-
MTGGIFCCRRQAARLHRILVAVARAPEAHPRDVVYRCPCRSQNEDKGERQSGLHR